MCIDPVSLAAIGTAVGTAASSATAAVGGAGALSTALSIGSTVAGFVGQQQAADSANTAALANAQSASMAAQRKYEDEQRKYIYDSRGLQQQGYDATMAGRSAVATGTASTGSSGIQVGSVSIASLLAAQRQLTAENLSRVNFKQDDLFQSFDSRVESIEAEAAGRIASRPMSSGPSALALGLNIATDGVKYGTKQGWFDPSPVS